MGDIRVRITAIDRFTPELHRARYHCLTPIGHRIPLRGTLHRQQLELAVRLRQAGRAIARAIPGGTEVPWAKVGSMWMRRLEWLGVVYLVFVALLVAYVLLAGR